MWPDFGNLTIVPAVNLALLSFFLSLLKAGLVQSLIPSGDRNSEFSVP
jgi:hypothetical protein